MIEVTYFRGEHQGGTKEYHLYVFRARKTGKALLVKRWGKIGADGQVKVERIGREDDAFDKALKERAAKGYDMRRQTLPSSASGVVESVNAALLILPISTRRSFFNSDLAHLDPDTYDATARGTYDPMASDRDKLRAEMEAKAREEAEAERRAEELAEAEHMKSNPFYGMF
jgi:predicted DNA-binding WGR domain protein